MTVRQLSTDFAILKPDLAMDTIPANAELYRRLDEDYQQFHKHTLISRHSFSRDWGQWERHPAGDEMVLLLSGQFTLVIDNSDTTEYLHLQQPGDYAIVPKGSWHTAQTDTASEALFITPGEGTQHRE